MKANHADITVVLDRSGSMSSIADDTVGGFNRFLADQKKTAGSCTFTLHQFDHEFETVVPGRDIQSVEPLTSRTFVPRGNTALLDAIGRSIKDTGSRLENASDSERASKVIFVIITDGQENASQEFQHSKIKEMIEHQKKVYSWEFVYLGANQDAISVGAAMGVGASNSSTYSAGKHGTATTYNMMSAKATLFRSGATASMAYSAQDNAEQSAANAKDDEEKS